VPEDKCPYTVVVRFEWDPRKANANLRAHGTSFAEAVTVLEDAFALTREDLDAVEEQRFVTLGLSDQGTCWWSCTCTRAGYHPNDLRVEGKQASKGAL
jgi:uncharacterized protein